MSRDINVTIVADTTRFDHAMASLLAAQRQIRLTAENIVWQLGKTILEAYQMMPWYHRLWFDLRHGAFKRNLAAALRSLR